jgi:hypothetical protein
MSSNPIELGNFPFHNKDKAKVYIRTEIFRDYPLRAQIDNPGYIALLDDVLRLKPNADDAEGVGIDYFFVALKSDFHDEAEPDAKVIAIHRFDHSEDDLEYERVLDGSSEIVAVKDALRREVTSLESEYRSGRFDGGREVSSDIDAEPIATPEDSEVRYGDPTWGQLTQGFASQMGGWNRISTHVGNGSSQIEQRLVDEAVREAWVDYHRANAHMLLTLKKGH